MSEIVRGENPITRVLNDLCFDGKVPGSWQDGQGYWWIPDALANRLALQVKTYIEDHHEVSTTPDTR